MLKCKYCNKIYKREKSLLSHQKKCTKNNLVRPSLDVMWEIIKKQQQLLEDQQIKIERLENIINKEVKKIDVVEWLNKNIEREINFSDWVKRNLNITKNHMLLIMKNNYINTISQIIKENFKYDKESVPIYCFCHQKKCIYIYENKWIKAYDKDIKMLFDEINVQLLRHNIEYENTLNSKKLYSRPHLEGNERLFLVDAKKRDNVKNKIKKELVSLFKIDLNELNKYKFYI